MFVRMIAQISLILLWSIGHAGVPAGADVKEWSQIREIVSDTNLSPQWRDAAGRSPAYYHLSFGSEDDALKYVDLMKAGSGFNDESSRLMDVAVLAGAQRVIRRLLELNASPNARTDAVSPLMLAAERGQLEIMRMLLKAGADPNYELDRYTAAHYALRAAQPFAFLLLVDNRLDLKRLRNDSTEYNVLFLVVQNDLRELVPFLEGQRFDLNLPRVDGRTPLHVASALLKMEMIAQLIRSGADPCIKDADGLSASEVYVQKMKSKFPTVQRELRTPFSRVRCN